ncbi:MAG: hypothetical protein JWN63_2824 [Candidatus Acidoferrum typicum]|nr:hypothetical protein [Candidatus Acidoferrum typicum]
MAIRKNTPPAEPLKTYPTTEIHLRGLEKALDRRYPAVMPNSCVLQSNCLRPNRFQTTVFTGERSDLAFVPPSAFSDGNHVDQWGDTWLARSIKNGTWYVTWHSYLDVRDTPEGARKWPQTGIAAQVSQMLRVIAKRPRAVRT